MIPRVRWIFHCQRERERKKNETKKGGLRTEQKIHSSMQRKRGLQ